MEHDLHDTNFLATYPCSPNVRWRLSEESILIESLIPKWSLSINLSDVKSIEYKETGWKGGSARIIRVDDIEEKNQPLTFALTSSKDLPERWDFLQKLESIVPDMPHSKVKNLHEIRTDSVTEKNDATEASPHAPKTANESRVPVERTPSPSKEERKLTAAERKASRKDASARAVAESDATDWQKSLGTAAQPEGFLGEPHSNHMRLYKDRIVVVVKRWSASVEKGEYEISMNEVDKFQWVCHWKVSSIRAHKANSSDHLDVASDPLSAQFTSRVHDEMLETVRRIYPHIPVVEVELLNTPRGRFGTAMDPDRTATEFARAALTLVPGFAGAQHISDLEKILAITDDGSKLCLIQTRSKASRVYEARDLISVEVFEDGRSVARANRGRQIGAALVGGWLAGNTGAVIGGLGAKSKTHDVVNSMSLRLELDDPTNPIVDFKLLNGQTKKGGGTHRASDRRGRTWASLLSAIIRKSDRAESNATSATVTVPPPNNVVDELSKLADLFTSGALSKEEFDHLKKRIIGG